MRAIVGLGANLGFRWANLRDAIHLLEQAGLLLREVSPVYRSEAVGPGRQRDYLNAAVALTADEDPFELLEVLQTVEHRLGRTRRESWGPRTIDLDLLWTSTGAVSSRSLTVPHPGLLERSFALAPLLDVLPDAPLEWHRRLGDLGGPPERLSRLLRVNSVRGPRRVGRKGAIVGISRAFSP